MNGRCAAALYAEKTAGASVRLCEEGVAMAEDAELGDDVPVACFDASPTRFALPCVKLNIPRAVGT